MGAESSSITSIRRLSQSHNQQFGELSANAASYDTPSTSQNIQSYNINRDNREVNEMGDRREKQGGKGTLVVVNDSKGSDDVQDPLLTRLREIKSFEPIMQEVEDSFWSKKALKSVQSRIKSYPLCRISSLYSDRLRKYAESVAIEQGRLSKCVKEVDYSVTIMMKAFTVRQKKFASHAEKFNTISGMCRSLSRCNKMLAECLSTAEYLNDLLPIDERLEPFKFT